MSYHCLDCGEEKTGQKRKGLCGRCYQRRVYHADPKAAAAKKREWTAANPERVSESWARTRERRDYSKYHAAQKIARLANDAEAQKIRARERFVKTIKSGWIARPVGMDFHHPDYARPFFGAWVTRKTHRQIHAGLAECPQCFDYASYVQLRGALSSSLAKLRSRRVPLRHVGRRRMADARRADLITAIDKVRLELPYTTDWSSEEAIA